VRKFNLDLKVLIILCVFFISGKIHAQLGFCQGNSGDPIFVEDFGEGIDDVALPPGTTTYTYANGQPPDDGLYTVTSYTNYFDWFSTGDHTPNDTHGRMLIVNSSFSAGEFYRTSIDGLCENTTYEFSSWLLNLAPLNGFCGAGAIPVNVRFEIWDSTDTNLLASGNTGNITGTLSPTWDQYALVFQTIPNQTSVILKMINNSSGGCGNDVAIDDIVFKSCGDLITIEDSNGLDFVNTCNATAFADTLTAIPDFAVFSTHFYQWQTSTDGINWTDVPGETNASIAVTSITTTTYFRAKVAEFQINLNNEDCITLSDVYQILVNQAPPPPILECWESAIFDDASCNWVVTGNQPAEPTGLDCWETAIFNTTTCAWEITGTQPMQPTTECWETATFNTTTCSWEVTGTQPAEPTGLACWETASFNNTTCTWEITGTQPAEPTGLECWETTNFNTITCAWEITGTQPTQPTLACWETATFNTITCTWDVSGTQPAEPTGLECWETTIFNTTTCTWEITGTQPVEPTGLACWETATFDSNSCSWQITGTQPAEPTDLQCWESTVFNTITCSWEVSGTQPDAPTDLECWQTTSFNTDTCSWDIEGTQPLEFRDEFRSICEDGDLTLIADSTISNPQYQWDSGEMSQSITIQSAGTYEVEVTDGCLTEIITFIVSEIANPEIESVVSEGSTIIVTLSNPGNYQYSLDGFTYQFSNIFTNVPIGLYTIYVKSDECPTVITQEHFHFFIPKFITPNSDGDNDFFALNVTQFFTRTEVYIFDRYGKILYSAINTNALWDGTYGGKDLPTSDYWYRIVLDGIEIKGHFTLKR